MSKNDVIGAIIVFLIFAIGAIIGFALGAQSGAETGYTAALDDIRLGKTTRYKLVQTAEKWVEVER